MKAFYKLFSYLNLDVTAGTVISTAAVAQYLGVKHVLLVYWLLGSSTWMIYTLDRLLDGLNRKGAPMSDRHLFHWRYRKPLGAVLFTLFVVDTYLALTQLSSSVLYFGLLMLLTAGIYLLLVQLFRPGYFPKEVLIALVYTAAIWGPSLLIKAQCSFQHFGLFLLHSLLAFENLLLFASMETAEDRQSGHSSIAIFLGERYSRYCLRLMGVLYLLLLLISAWLNPDSRLWALLFFLMHMVLQVIFLAPQYFRQGHRYRYLGDAVFCFPVLFLF